METIHGFKRTSYCGEVTAAQIGQQAKVCGWVQKQRDLGNLIFIDLRDRTGIVQLAFDDGTDRAIFEKAFSARAEFVLAVTGTVRERESKNPDLKNGDIEIYVTELRVLAKAKTPPFEINDSINVKDEVRLRYRYLDLRRPEVMAPLLARHKIVKAARDYFDRNDFLEIETPMLIKSTPEGARDYLVPSRVHPGAFYALPQSPQMYKQLLMLSGFDRYMQVVKCFRDEDLRADRQPEFTQIDLEMSFVEEDDVMSVNEGFMKYVFQEILGRDIPTPFLRMPYREAMERFGSDKPDTRFGMELCDLGGALKDCTFKVFSGALEAGGRVMAINAKGLYGELSRKQIDKLTDFVKTYRAKGLAFTRLGEDGTASSSFEKFLTEEEVAAVRQAADLQPGRRAAGGGRPERGDGADRPGRPALRTGRETRPHRPRSALTSSGSPTSPSSSTARRRTATWPSTTPSPPPLWRTWTRSRATPPTPGPAPTTWCSTAARWAAAPSASPTPRCRTGCLRPWASPRRRRTAASASSSTPSPTACPPTAAWPTASTGW